MLPFLFVSVLLRHSFIASLVALFRSRHSNEDVFIVLKVDKVLGSNP